MRKQVFNKSVVSILVAGAFCAAAVVLGAQALSKAHPPAPAAAAAKAKASDATPAPSVSRDRATTPDDATGQNDSWKRWPSLTDF